MELKSNKVGSNQESLNELEINNGLIKVRAIIRCPTCSYLKKFKNQFHHSEIETMIVSLKIFDWMTCNKCGELLQLNLEFNL